MLEFDILKSKIFEKQLKLLLKKYKNAENDLDYFLKNIQSIQDLGVSLGKNIFKARIKNSNNSRGKSGGYRLITLLKIEDEKIILLYIYSKKELEKFHESKLDRIIISQLKLENS